MLAVQRLPAGKHLGIRETETVALGRRGWPPPPPCSLADVSVRCRAGRPVLRRRLFVTTPKYSVSSAWS